jgi:hypothetical protein
MGRQVPKHSILDAPPTTTYRQRGIVVLPSGEKRDVDHCAKLIDQMASYFDCVIEYDADLGRVILVDAVLVG